MDALDFVRRRLGGNQMSTTSVQVGGSGIRGSLQILAMCLGAVFIVSLLLMAIVHFYVGAFLLLLGIVGGIAAAGQLVLARGRAIKNGRAIIWNGLAEILSWNPTEGVLFLKNKQPDFADDNPNDGGGVHVIYPLLGHELILKIPLEIQTLTFRDSEVLTLEYMPLTIQGTLYWKISNITRFYLSISKEIHSASDNGGHSVTTNSSRPQMEVAEQWLRAMAESKTRAIVSKTGTGLLIADQLASDLPTSLPQRPLPAASSSYRSAADGLAEVIRSDFASLASEYGLEIHRIALQEIKLPSEIYAAAVDACKSAYLPLKAQAEAAELRMKLQAEADVIGAEALGMKEIAGNIPALAFQEFLSPLFLDFNRKRGIGSQLNP